MLERAAYRATSHLEGDKSWSDFVERAILAEVERRELSHNEGEPSRVSLLNWLKKAEVEDGVEP